MLRPSSNTKKRILNDAYFKTIQTNEMKKTIFVPVLTSDAQWIFCNQQDAFNLGLIHAEGKILSGYNTAEEAIAAYKERQTQEPFAVLHLILPQIWVEQLCLDGILTYKDQDSADRLLWKLTQEGCQIVYERQVFELLMQIVPVERTGICLY